MKLTEKIVETALYEGRSGMSKSGRKRWSRHVIWDDALPGFGLRITPTNRKRFVVSYRAGGRKRTKTLGSTDKLSLDEARRRAAELLDSTGETPNDQAEVESVGALETVSQLADAYLERHLKGTVPSWYADQRLIQVHIKPALGRSPIAEVSRTDLANLRIRVGRRFPDDGRRLQALLAGMFDWAAAHGLWSGSSRQRRLADRGDEVRGEPAAASGAETAAAPASTTEEPAETAPLPPAEELADELRKSEALRHDLAAQLEEVSDSGVEMLRKLNEQADAQRQLENDLAKSQRALQRLEARGEREPDPGKTQKQLANLRQSVEQLLASVRQAEAERDGMADKLAQAEARAARQGEKVAALARARSELESKIREEQRKAAIRKVQKRGEAGQRWPLAPLLAGALAGALVVLLAVRWLAPTDPGAGAAAGSGGRTVAPDATAVAAPAESGPAEEAVAAPGESDPASEAVAAEPAPAREDAPAPAPGGEPAADPTGAEEAVAAWAAAWSEQRVDDYLAAYSERFQPADGSRRGEWESQRRNRIQRPRSIHVTLGPLERTVLDDGRVRVSFEQSYETESYSDRVTKTLELVREDGAWKILSERAG